MLMMKLIIMMIDKIKMKGRMRMTVYGLWIVADG